MDHIIWDAAAMETMELEFRRVSQFLEGCGESLRNCCLQEKEMNWENGQMTLDILERTEAALRRSARLSERGVDLAQRIRRVRTLVDGVERSLLHEPETGRTRMFMGSSGALSYGIVRFVDLTGERGRVTPEWLNEEAARWLHESAYN